MQLHRSLFLMSLFLFAHAAFAQDAEPDAELEYYQSPYSDEARAKDSERKLPIVLKPVNESMTPPRLTFVAGPHKDEQRVDLRQFGLRPTVVLVAGLTNPRHIINATKANRDAYYDGMAAAIVTAEKLAAGWAKKGVETLLLFDESNGPASDDGPVKSARLKHLSIALATNWVLCPQVPGLALRMRDMRDLAKTSDAASQLEDYQCWTQWMWMPEPSRIEALGGAWSDKQIDKLVKDAADKLKPMGRDKRVEKVLEQIALLQIEDAVKGIEKLAAGPDNKRPSEEVMAALNERLQALEPLQRRVLVRNHEVKGFVVEQVEQLEALGDAFDDHAIGERIADEVAALKATDNYAHDVKAKPVYDRLYKQFIEVEAPMNSSNETPKEHYRKIFQAYKHLKSPTEKFVKEHGESVYAKEVREWHAFICDAERQSQD